MIIKNILILLVVVLHIYFLILEMFLWTKPMGLKTFGNTLQRAQDTAVLAANQGLYNGFLAAGLLWSLIYPHPVFANHLAVFFLLCVIVASLYGAYSVGKKILIIQGIPAIIALAFVFALSGDIL